MGWHFWKEISELASNNADYIHLVNKKNSKKLVTCEEVGTCPYWLELGLESWLLVVVASYLPMLLPTFNNLSKVHKYCYFNFGETFCVQLFCLAVAAKSYLKALN